MLFAVLKIEMKRTCLFPVCFQLSLSCLSLHSGNLHENKPKKDLSSVQSRARRVWPWLQLPQLGPCSSVEPGEPQAVQSPPPAPSLQAVPSCSGTALTRAGHCHWSVATCCTCVLALLTLLPFPSGSVGSEQHCCSSSMADRAPASGWICQGATTEALGKISLLSPLLLEMFLQMPVAHPSSMYPFPGLLPSLLPLGGFCCQL